MRAPISDVLLNDSRSRQAFTSPVRPKCFRKCGGRLATTSRNIRLIRRLVGETGGKDFILAHASAEPDALITAIVRGGFEYQGQKCSAASRVYIPDNVVEADQGEADRNNEITSSR